METRLSPALLPAIALLSVGCVTPFSDFQSAGLLRPGGTELTTHYSYVTATGDGESDKVQDEFGLQLGRGLRDAVELRGRLILVRVDDESAGVVGLGPKFRLVEDRVAFYAPIGFGFGSGIDVSETLQIQPTLLLGLPVGENADLMLSGKALLWLQGDSDNQIAFNLGLGLRPGSADWVIRPEVGLLRNPGEDGTVWQFGVGLSQVLGGAG